MIADSRNYILPYQKKPNGFLLCVKYRLSESEKWSERRKVVSAKSETEARKLAAQFEKDLLSGKERLARNQQSLPVTALSVREAHSRYLADLAINKVTDSTQDSAKIIFHKYFDPAIGKSVLKNFGPEEIRKLKISLSKMKDSKTVSAKTINYYLTRFSSFMAWAVEDNLIEEMPKLKKLKFKIRSEEDERVIDFKDLIITPELFQTAVTKAKEENHLLCMLFLGGHMGLRRGEMVGLRFSDIDLNNGWLEIRNQRDRKGLRHCKTYKNKVPRLPLTDQTKNILIKIKNQNPDSEYVLTKKNGKLPHPNRLFDWMRVLFDSGNIHALRHFALSEMARKNLPPSFIMQFARHRTLRMTTEYLDTTYADLLKVSEAISQK